MTTGTSSTPLRGEVLRDGDAGYDEARRIWNAAFDRRPAIIVRVHEAGDAAAALLFAARHGLEVAVRGGGHSLAGHSVCEGGLMLDLSPLRGIEVDPAGRRATVGAGVLWGELDAATQAHGLAVTGGEVSHTGVAGLTLGGGIGLLKRRFGLTCDNLEAVELVTVDGRVVWVDDAADPELMWGLRGGGGNFGVATRFVLRLHPVGPLLPAAHAVYRPDRAAEALTGFARAAADAPDALTLSAVLVPLPPAPFVPADMVGRPGLVVNAVWVSDDPAPDLAAAASTGGPPAGAMAADTPYVALQSMVDPFAPHGRANRSRSEWLADVSPSTAEALVAAAEAMPSRECQIVLHQMGGAAGRVAPDATAFRRRDAPLMMLVNAAWTPGEDGSRHDAWVTRVWEATLPDSAGGAYVNHLGREGEDRVRAAYGEETFRRLAALKARMDPANLLRRNQNFPPRAG